MLVLEQERTKRGWNKSELARRAGIQQGTIGQIESGRLSRPYKGTLSNIATALDWQSDPADLLTEVEE